MQLWMIRYDTIPEKQYDEGKGTLINRLPDETRDRATRLPPAILERAACSWNTWATRDTHLAGDRNSLLKMISVVIRGPSGESR